MSAVLKCAGVSKRFQKVVALDDVSLAVAPGERVALLGHNGAGKTTLFRLVLGFIRPDAGALTIDDHAPGANAARIAVSYLPENVAFPKTLTGREIARFYARLKGAPKGDADRALERVGLADAVHRRVGGYSKGMRQRLGLAQALVGRPRLMLLDEPTSGLDPISRRDFYELLDEVATAGTAVLLSSHSLSELEARTDRVAILRSGRLVADAPLAQLQADAALPIRIRVRARPDHVEEVSARLGGDRINGQSVELLCPLPQKMDRLAAISALGPLVTDFDVAQPSLDDIYRHFSATGTGGAS
ncbi:ABC transporter ATP-binding protein [Notoacmeibacter marinus]|uniref:ABC transporter ATP-binding protein n=1 Tax=Notoacmeibacter marinus TaxID=1876515 RepID=UPI000DF23696|nr:ABC transporter ATP-binding protein [Notoacmeibacter marinus]